MVETRLGDFIRVSVRTTSAVTLIISGLIKDQRRGNKIRAIGPFIKTVSVVDASEVVENFPGLPDGELISLNIRTSTNGLQRGECWIVVSITNQNYPDIPVLLMFADYLTSGTQLGFPGSVITDPLSGVGALMNERIQFEETDPILMPGVYLLEHVVRNNVNERMMSILAAVDMAVDGDTGSIQIQINGGGSTVEYFAYQKYGFIASASVDLNFCALVGSSSDAGVTQSMIIPIPDIILKPGDKINVAGIRIAPGVGARGYTFFTYRQWILPMEASLPV